MRQERRVEALRSRSPGRKLDPDVRADMEARLGGSLRHARVHTDTRSAATARSLGAKAFTIGSDVHFGPQQYQPHTAAGGRLLAHELAHVLQESAAPSAARTGVVSAPHARSEVAATRAAHGAGGPAVAGPLPAVHLQIDTTLRPRPEPRVARLMGYRSLEGFATDSASLTPDHAADIASVAPTLRYLLQMYPTGLVHVTGHTDATGSEAHNLGLGTERARAVAAALEAAGVPASAIIEDSAGESQLRVRTRRQHPRNRRVEITFQPERRVRFPDLELRRDPPPPPPPPLDLRVRPPTEKEEFERRLRDLLLRPPPPLPQRPTIGEALRRRLEEEIDRATRGAPQWVRDGLRRGVVAGIEKGARAGVDGLLDAAGITGESREAIDAIIDRAGDMPVP